MDPSEVLQNILENLLSVEYFKHFREKSDIL